jgi:hypothetical protein
MKTTQKITTAQNVIRKKRSKTILKKGEEKILFPEKLKIAEDILKKFPPPENLLK